MHASRLKNNNGLLFITKWELRYAARNKRVICYAGYCNITTVDETYVNDCPNYLQKSVDIR